MPEMKHRAGQKTLKHGFTGTNVTCDKGMPKEILFIDENRNLFINAEN
jgi:hypothetical protein